MQNDELQDLKLSCRPKDNGQYIRGFATFSATRSAPKDEGTVQFKGENPIRVGRLAEK